MNALAWRQFRRHWRAGEFLVLLWAMTVAVAAISAVGFFTGRVQGALEAQANELLAADLVVDTGQPAPPEWPEHAAALGLRTARMMEFPSMVQHAGGMQLVEVKAVEEGYPLRGGLKVAGELFGAETAAPGIPAPGTAWGDARLFQNGGLSPGGGLTLGALGLRLERVVTFEPDRGSVWFGIAPRLLVNARDIPATGLVAPGSRIAHRLLVAGEPQALADFRAWIAPRLGPGQRLLGVRDVRQEVSQALARGERFLGLAALVAVLVAAVAIALGAYRFTRRQLDTVALMRCFGAPQRLILGHYLLQLALVGLLAVVLGCLIGYGAQEVLIHLVREYLHTALPAPGLKPVLHAALTLAVATLGFALPTLLRLREVPPLRVLRREAAPPRASARLTLGAALLALALLALLVAGEWKLVLWVLGGVAGGLLTLTAATLLLMQALRPLRRQVGVAWRFGLANVLRRRELSLIQIASLGVGLLVLLLLSVVRLDLLQGWRDSLPPDTPNHFLINIQPGQLPALEDFFRARGQPAPAFHPMVRGRWVGHNGAPPGIDALEDPRARRLAQREFNLSWARELQADNRITAGRWWGQSPADARQLSVEEGLAKTLGIALGDTLTFAIGGEELSATVTSLRAVDWDSFRANFFVLLPPQALEGLPASYISSLHLPPGSNTLPTALVRDFPNVTVIDVAGIMERVRAIIERVTQAVEGVFLFTLAAGVMVMIAAIQATREERVFESAILRALGASSRQVRLGLWSEFALLGLLAGLLAAALSLITGWGLARYAFDMPYHINWWLLPAGGLGGAIGIGLAGYLAARSVLRHPPLTVLRG